jgi:hypothetical protein
MMKSKMLAVAVLSLFLGLWLTMPTSSQITTPNVFTTSVPVSQLNTNFSTLGSGALNRAGGTITGNIAVDPGVTIDGVDISAVVGSSATPSITSMTLSSTGASALDVAGGINAGSGNVGIVDTSGRIPALSSIYLSNMSGANLTGLLFSQLPTTWTTPTFAAGNFTTNGAGGWTVEAGDVTHNRYVEIGKTMHWNIQLATTTVTAATGTELRLTIPNSRVANTSAGGSLSGIDNGTAYNGFWFIDSAGTTVRMFVNNGAATNWTAAANTTSIRASITFEIQ